MFIKYHSFILIIKLLNYLSNLKFISKEPFKKLENSIFKGMSVAFIADGNRRWIKNTKYKNKDCIKVKMGVEEFVKFAYFYNFDEISFFCFSIKNFKRENKEINEIMNFIKKYKIFKNFPIKLKIYGRMNLLEREVREVFERYEKETEDGKGLKVNIFFAYSSSDEQRMSVDIDIQGVDMDCNCMDMDCKGVNMDFKGVDSNGQNRDRTDGEMDYKGVNMDCKGVDSNGQDGQKMSRNGQDGQRMCRNGQDGQKMCRNGLDCKSVKMNQNYNFYNNLNVDLLIRTSGEKRLSDFMVKQVCNGTAIEFIKPFWPDFSLIHLFLILLKYKLENKILFGIKK